MNWYIISQISENEKRWKKFPPNRQREFPFMHEPGYQRKAVPFLETDSPSWYDIDHNLYHVTTNLAGVISSGRLKSRDELGGTVGLGGGFWDEGSNTVSVTYSYDKALSIYNDIKYVLEIVSGSVSASNIFGSFAFSETNDMELRYVLLNWIKEKDINGYFTGRITPSNFDSILNLSISGPKNLYDFWKELEGIVVEQRLDELEYSEFSDIGVTGFTGQYEDMIKIDSSQVAILQLVARKNASPEHVILELELRFKPEDLRVIRYLQP